MLTARTQCPTELLPRQHAGNLPKLSAANMRLACHPVSRKCLCCSQGHDAMQQACHAEQVHDDDNNTLKLVKGKSRLIWCGALQGRLVQIKVPPAFGANQGARRAFQQQKPHFLHQHQQQQTQPLNDSTAVQKQNNPTQH